jgi:hypothetical protein
MILVSCMHMIGLELIFTYELVQVLYPGAEPEILNSGVKATYNTSFQQYLMVSFFAYAL